MLKKSTLGQDCGLLGWDTVVLWAGSNISEYNAANNFKAEVSHLIPENGGGTFSQNVGIHPQHYMMSQNGRPQL
jgi:hypothetical protein